MQGADNKTYNKKYRQHSSHGETSDLQLWKQCYQVLLFRCRNSTFFAGVSCDQTKKKLILFSIIKSLKTVTNKSRKI